jgi:hypothetical protein
MKKVFTTLTLLLILLGLSSFLADRTFTNEDYTAQLIDTIWVFVCISAMLYGFFNFGLHSHLVEKRVNISFTKVAFNPVYLLKLYNDADEKIKTESFNMIASCMNVFLYNIIFGLLVTIVAFLFELSLH